MCYMGMSRDWASDCQKCFNLSLKITHKENKAKHSAEYKSMLCTNLLLNCSIISFYMCKLDVKNNWSAHQDLDQRTSTLLFRDSRRHTMSVSLLLLLLLYFFLSLTLLSLPALLPGSEQSWWTAWLLDGGWGGTRHIVVLWWKTFCKNMTMLIPGMPLNNSG